MLDAGTSPTMIVACAEKSRQWWTWRWIASGSERLDDNYEIRLGYAYNDIASMLGGRPWNEQGKVSKGGINRDVINVVLDFAEVSEQVKSRAPATKSRE